jgi:hypothetical protein
MVFWSGFDLVLTRFLQVLVSRWGRLTTKTQRCIEEKDLTKCIGGGGKMADLGVMGERANLGEVRECGVVSCVL